MPTDYTIVFDSAGAAVGFRRYRWIYNLDGTPIGMTKGNHVYKLTGHYIGEIDDDMVVDAGLTNVPDTSEPGAPQNPGSIANPKGREARPDAKDVFSQLLG